MKREGDPHMRQFCQEHALMPPLSGAAVGTERGRRSDRAASHAFVGFLCWPGRSKLDRASGGSPPGRRRRSELRVSRFMSRSGLEDARRFVPLGSCCIGADLSPARLHTMPAETPRRRIGLFRAGFPFRSRWPFRLLCGGTPNDILAIGIVQPAENVPPFAPFAERRDFPVAFTLGGNRTDEVPAPCRKFL